MTVLRLADAGLAIDGAWLVRGAQLTLPPGQLAALIGPNGAGKTSLLRLMLGLVRPSHGSATIDAVTAHALPAADRARRVAYLPQQRPLAWPQRVRDVVALGRFAHGAVLGRLGTVDAAAVARALAAADLDAFADRAADTLSGGETARMHLARALASEAPLIVADEPVAALDPLHQHHTMRILRDFVDAGGGALVVLHDLDLAARFANRLIWMSAGAIVADGSVADTMTPARIAAVHGVSARLIGDGGDRHVVIDGPAPLTPRGQ